MHASHRAALLLALAFLIPGVASSQGNIPPGFDTFVHQDSTWWDFSPQPIPADFFGPGSDPFDGIVAFHGFPLGPTPECPVGLTDSDMIVQRWEPAVLPMIGSIDTIDVQLIHLELVSAAPIVIDYLGGAYNELWDVRMTLSSVAPSMGSYVIMRTHAGGGEFTAYFDVEPKWEFTRIGDSYTVTLDGGGVYTDNIIGGSDYAYPLPGWICPDCGLDFVACHDGTSKKYMVMFGTSFMQRVTNDCEQDVVEFPPGPDDDITSSLGSFTLWVEPAYRPLFDGCPGWDDTSRVYSPALYDPAVGFGRSAVHYDGDFTDSTGTLVGLAGTIVSDADLTLRPPGFEGPPGSREIHTEIVEMALADPGGTTVRAGLPAPTLPKSPGEIEQKITPGIDFPAESFFDVYMELDLPPCGPGFPGATIYNPDALLIANDFLPYPPGLPPEAIYVHGNEYAVAVVFAADDPGGLWSAGDQLGYIVKYGQAVGYADTPQHVAFFDSVMSITPEMPLPPLLIPAGFNGYVHLDPTEWDFGPVPLPADYFGPGSDPFDGIVAFEGVPLAPDTFCVTGWDHADMVVHRLGDLDFPMIGAMDTVSVRIHQLHLQGIHPITVTYDGGEQPETWLVTMRLDGTQSTGTLWATQTHLDGGEFTMNLPIRPEFTFVRESDLMTLQWAGPPYTDDCALTIPMPFYTGVPPGSGLDCEDCESLEFIPGSDGVATYAMPLDGFMFNQMVGTACQHGDGYFPPGPDDDLTLGLFEWRVIELLPFEWVETCPEYFEWNETYDMVPIVFDPDMVIGRSAPHLNISIVDTAYTDTVKVAVGTAQTMISDADMPLRPVGFDGETGTREIHTEIVDMNMSSANGLVIRAGQSAPSRPMCPGEIESKYYGGTDFPAESFFDVFFEMDIPPCGDFPGAMLRTETPLLLWNDNLTDPPGLPPRAVFVHGNDMAIPLIFAYDDTCGHWWDEGDLFGFIVSAGLGIGYDNTPGDIAELELVLDGTPDMPYDPTGVADTPPELGYHLDVNVPNPFNPVTTIQYGVAQPGVVSLRVYNVAGQVVKTLVNERQTPRAGGYAVNWDGTDNRANRVASGVYFYRLVANDFVKTRKMVLLK